MTTTARGESPSSPEYSPIRESFAQIIRNFSPSSDNSESEPETDTTQRQAWSNDDSSDFDSDSDSSSNEE